MEVNKDADIKAIDAGMCNVFKWEWLLVRLKDDEDCILSDYFKKVDIAGKAKCIICDQFITYGATGIKALERHVAREHANFSHKTTRRRTRRRITNETLPTGLQDEIESLRGDLKRAEEKLLLFEAAKNESLEQAKTTDDLITEMKKRHDEDQEHIQALEEEILTKDYLLADMKKQHDEDQKRIKALEEELLSKDYLIPEVLEEQLASKQKQDGYDYGGSNSLSSAGGAFETYRRSLNTEYERLEKEKQREETRRQWEETQKREEARRQQEEKESQRREETRRQREEIEKQRREEARRQWEETQKREETRRREEKERQRREEARRQWEETQKREETRRQQEEKERQRREEARRQEEEENLLAVREYVRVKRAYHCGICGGEGHNRRTCSLNPDSVSSNRNSTLGFSSSKRQQCCGICRMPGHNRCTCSRR